jgi:hypothetical protein
MTRRCGIACVTACGLLLGATDGTGQTAGGGAGGAIDHEIWSALRPIADLEFAVPGAGLEFPRLLIRPAPRTGLFWSDGNPAGLALDPAAAWSGYTFESGRSNGEYRRTMEAATRSWTRLGAVGWTPAGERAAAAGRFLTDRGAWGAPYHANVVGPYGSSPLAVVDTTGTEVGRTTAVIEGAGALRLGPVAVGTVLGFDAQESSSVEAAVPRRFRSATPAGAIGWRSRFPERRTCA